MFNITGYTITHTLYESANSIIYRGVRADTNRATILKVLRTDYPTLQQISQFYKEYECTKDLHIPGIRHAIETITLDNKPALLLEYVDGVTLNEAFIEQQPSFPAFLKAAMQIAQIVGDLHHHRIIHKDINPSNILISPQHETITIIDFGMASTLTLKIPHLGNPEQLEGTLLYMSPEQSGRMNRIVDFRSDLYSLGATLYACVTGRPPFEHDDPLTLIHAHIAKRPTPPIDLIGPDSSLFVPHHAALQALSDVIMKLLSKKAEDRYQSALGARCDLEQIAAMPEDPQTAFQLGRDDVSEQLLMPETLYGREHEINLLLQAFRDLTSCENLSGLHTSALALVSDSAGVGKSALVSEIHKPMTEQHGYFIQGKFDQYQRNIPYSAFRLLLACSSKKFLRPLRKQIKKAGLQEKVESRIGLPKEGLYAYYRQAICTVVPLTRCDRNELQGCCPLKILESMAAGTPVVASNLAVCRELIEHGSDSWLVSPDSSRRKPFVKL
ncbi:MAG: protein kinase [bacterium]|nr:protein kinase [bacterium]